MANLVQFQFPHRNYLFTLRIGFSLLWLFLFSVLCTLGIWQIHRYHQKQALIISSQQLLHSEPKTLLNLQTEVTQFQRVKVQGYYLNDLTMLIQNKIYNGELGYEVLTPLKINGTKELLIINRGWIKEPNPQSLPKIDPVNDMQSLIGYVKLVDEHQFILGKNILYPQSHPLVIQKIDMHELATLTHESYFPFIVRLDPTQPHGYIRDWIITAVEPQRHLGYAVQWFAMAFALVIAYFCFSCERIGVNDANK